ncbi:MAG: alpha/beta hydrolase [Acidimicrobiales bacterium]
MSVVETCVVPSPTGELLVDVFRPTSTGNRCGIIFFHGGGWRALSREVMHVYAQPMAELGFVGLAADYRLLAKRRPAQIHDVKRFIRWARTNADQLGIDPERIVLWGAPAGAHLSLLAAGTPSDAFGDDSNDPDAASDDVAAVIASSRRPASITASRPSATSHRATRCSARGTTHQLPIEPVRSATSAPTSRPRCSSTAPTTTSSAIGTARMFEAPVRPGPRSTSTCSTATTMSSSRFPRCCGVAAEAAYFIDRFVIDPEQHRAEAEEFSLFARRAAEERRRHQ